MDRVSSVLDDALARVPGNTFFPCGETSRIIEGERRRAAVLFLDLTGFTLLSEAIDHEDLHVLLGRVMGLLSRVVNSCGGYVDKFEGDRLMALFGAIASTENDSARAVGCALRMLDLLDELRPALPEFPGLSARIGIDFGPLTVAPDPSGHLTATGLTVNLASRLEESASPGTALVSEAVRRECGELYSLIDTWKVSIRGISSPVASFEPTGPGKIRFERWERASRLYGAPFVGRSRVRESIGKALKPTGLSACEPPVFIMVGDPGIGKSRLAHECIVSLGEYRVLRGYALSHAQPSCWLWISLLRGYFNAGSPGGETAEWYQAGIKELAASCGEERPRTVLESCAPQLAAILSMDATGFENFSPEFSTVTNTVRSALEAVFSTSGTLLLLEDLQWADELSMRLLQDILSQGLFIQPAGIIMTTRLPAPVLLNPSLSVNTIYLEPLSDDDCLSIAAYLLQTDLLDDELKRLIRSVGRGNPFFVEELVLSLIESDGILRNSDDCCTLSLSCDQVKIPGSISVLTQARMDRLPKQERRILQYASVLGERFETTVLDSMVRRVSELGDNLGEILLNLENRGFLSGADGKSFSFRHSLVRVAAYETLLKHNSRILHKAAAESIEQLNPTELDALAPVLFAHWEAAQDWKKSLEWASRAMMTARDGGRPEETLGFAKRIMELAGKAGDDRYWEERMNALLVWHEILKRKGEHEDAIRTADRIASEAREKNSLAWEGIALRARAAVLQELGRNPEFESTIEEAMKIALAGRNEILAAKINMTLANYRSSTGITEGVMDLYREATDVMEKHGMEPEAASLYSNMAVHAFRFGEDALSASYAEKAIRLQKKQGNLLGLGYSLNSLAIACARRERFERAEELFLEALDASRKTGDRIHESTLLGNLGLLAKKRGNIREAMEFTDASIELASRTRNYRTVAIALVNKANIQRMTGDFDGSMESANESLRINALTNDVLNTAYAMGVKGLLLVELDRLKEAETLCDQLRLHVERHRIKQGMLEDYRQLIEVLETRGVSTTRPASWSTDSP